MKVLELHMIQSIPSSNINRGEDGDTKTAIFGGTLRQRVSSQAWKRPIRMAIQKYCQENVKDFGKLSKNIEKRIQENCPTVNKTKLEKTLKGLGFNSDCLMYVSESEIQIISDYINGETELVDKDIKNIFKTAKNQAAFDIALFGRMFASSPELNVYGALKTSHAISTHTVELEDDYFTAVDELDNCGAGHIGHSTFTSSTMYRYYAIDLEQLKKNLNVDDISEYIDIILKSIILAFPTGKENSFAAYTRPSFVNVIVKNGQPYQFVNAFEKPVCAEGNGYIEPSINAYKEFKKNEMSFGFDEVFLDVEMDSEKNIQTISNLIKLVV
jgi:CRISPR system Cascade subunit CasC